MNQGTAEISDKITVLVFKDNYAARTFQIPLRWISRFGALLGVLSLLAVGNSLVALKYYRIAAKTDPTRTQDLEQEISEMRAHIRQLEVRAVDSSSRTPSQPISQPPPPAPDQTITSKPPIALSFPILPEQLAANLPNPTSLPFSVQTPKATWKGKTLKVRFALQYNKNDQGSQQGRILVLARGPGGLLAYPSGVFNFDQSKGLISPEKGEPFSVSRYREVRADFGPVQSQADIHEVEVLIFNKENQLLTYEKVPAQSAPKSLPKTEKNKTPHQAEAPEASAPAPESDSTNAVIAAPPESTSPPPAPSTPEVNQL
jgi:hypothetical protein